jgi:DNA-directed RNA polymerase specialized sigma24 family protein
VGLEEAPELADTASPATTVEIADAARVALGTLTERQTRVLLERPDTTLEELAGSLGVSRGTVDNEYRRAVLKVRDATPSEETFDDVLEMVLLLASE